MTARPLVAALLVVAMASGCATYQQSKKTAFSGGITTGASLVVAIVALSIASAAVGSGGASFSCGGSGVCEVASRVGLVAVVGVPIGAVVTLGGLLGMAGYSSGEPAPPPQLPPQVVDRFWCQRDSGICTNDQGTCGPDCLSATSIWCAPYKTTLDGERGLLCGVSSDVCFVLSISEHNRRGRESFGECAERTEPLPFRNRSDR